MLTRLVNLFWLWTILGTLWAWFFPSHFTWFLGVFPGTSVKLISLGLGVIMLGMGITLTWGDFREVLRMPRWVLIGVAAQFLIMPFIGWSVATLFALPTEFKLGIILVSCCPGGTASNVVTYLARGNLALSVLMTTVSTLLSVLLTPYLTKAYTAEFIEVNALAMVLSMITVVLLPVLGGILLNRFFGDRLGPIKAVAPLVSVFVIVLIVGAIVGMTKEQIIVHASSLLPAVFLVHASGFFMGYFWARLFGFADRERRTVSIEVGMQNSGLGSQLAREHFTVTAAAPCAISACYHCLIGSLLASIWSRLVTHSPLPGGTASDTSRTAHGE